MESLSRRELLGGISLLGAGVHGSGTVAQLSDTEVKEVTAKAYPFETLHLTEAQYQQLPFTPAFVAQGRVGGRGSGVTEHRIGRTINDPHQRVNKDWQNGETRHFTLSYAPSTNQAMYKNENISDLTYQPTVAGPYRDLIIRVVGAATGQIRVESLSLNGAPITDSFNVSNGVAVVRVTGISLQQGFTLVGKATMEWSGNIPNQNNQLYQLWVGRVT
jgi:hypothetical protein